jgi:peroxiredoxin 2/4
MKLSEPLFTGGEMQISTMVAKPAPDFTKPAVMGNGEVAERFSFYGHIEDRYAVLFFYPLDFTFVCPSEMLAHAHRAMAFRARDVVVVGVSLASVGTLRSWRAVPGLDGGAGPIPIPMVADAGGAVMAAYGVGAAEASYLRAAFLIDRSRMIRYAVLNDLPPGRNVEELLRAADALRFHEGESGADEPARSGARWQPAEGQPRPVLARGTGRP